MSDPVKLTQLDSKDIPRYSYDEDNRAMRVIMINNESPVPSNSPLSQTPIGSNFKLPDGAQYEALKQHFLSLPAPRIETRIERVEVPVIVKEIEIVEVQKIITEYKEIEKIIVVPEYITKEVEKLVTVTEYKTINVPQIVEKIVYVDRVNYKWLFIAQAITLGLIVLSKFIKL